MPLRTTSATAPLFQVLSEGDIEQLHEAVLHVLSEIGLDLQHERALSILKRAGAVVQGSRVRFPTGLVMDAIGEAPSSITLFSRDGQPAMVLEGREVHFGTYGTAPYAYDPYTGQRGPATTQTIADAARVCDYLPNIEWSMPMGVPSDAPTLTADRHQFYHAVIHNTKTLYSSAYTPEGMRDAIEMAAIVTGGQEALRQRPFFTTGINPSTPLRYGREVLGKLLVMADAGLPIIFNSCPMAGATAPATLASTIVVNLAEGLAGVTLAQLARPGVPVIPGGGPTIMDMSTTVCGQGAPELGMLVAGCAQMYRFYGLPSYGTAGGTNSKVVDPQAAMEATNSILLAALAGSNLVHCIGAIEDCMTVSLEAFILGDEIIAMARRIAGGIAVDEETLALDVLKQVGPGGHFIDQTHTLRHFREHHYSKLINRQIHDAWTLAGSKTMNERMMEKLRWILANHHPQPLPGDVLREMKSIIARAEA
jgi:trimethylamine--corrinoid protein Co-methyltransferase